MTETSIIHILGLIGKFLIAPVIGLGWWMFKKRDAEMQRERERTDKRITRLERRMMNSEKETAVIHSKLNDIREDSKEIKDSLSKLTEKLLK